ncbi:hypothetical protein JOD29_003341 [Lysinibacillus composti]|nr:hypothetical protein [Lysinibacillus composti]
MYITFNQNPHPQFPQNGKIMSDQAFRIYDKINRTNIHS